jgi:hypothetical protein
MQSTPFPALAFPAQFSPVPSRLLPLQPCGLGTPFQESLPGYLNRLAYAHRLPVATFVSREIVPLVSSSADRPQVSNYLGKGSRYLLLGDGLALKVAGHLARLSMVPQVSGLVHSCLAGALRWTRDLREYAAWCPQCLLEWKQTGTPLYFPLLWAFRGIRCCLLHNAVLRDTCPYCSHRFSYLIGRTWEGECFICRRSFLDLPPVAAPRQIEIDSTKLVHGLVTWAVGLSAPSAFLSVLLNNVTAAATAVGGAKPLSKAIGRSPTVVGFWLRHRQTPTLSSLLRLSLVFGVPLETWFSTGLGSERFQTPAALPGEAPWLSDRAAPVPATDIEAALRHAVDNPTESPPSLSAVAQSIPTSLSHLYHDFPKLASQIVARHRAFSVQRKVQYAAELAELVRGAVADSHRLRLPVTADAALANLGARWPLSRRRLRAVFLKISAASPKSLAS